jgi:hypothetical protein
MALSSIINNLKPAVQQVAQKFPGYMTVLATSAAQIEEKKRKEQEAAEAEAMFLASMQNPTNWEPSNPFDTPAPATSNPLEMTPGVWGNEDSVENPMWTMNGKPTLASRVGGVARGVGANLLAAAAPAVEIGGNYGNVVGLAQNVAPMLRGPLDYVLGPGASDQIGIPKTGPTGPSELAENMWAFSQEAADRARAMRGILPTPAGTSFDSNPFTYSEPAPTVPSPPTTSQATEVDVAAAMAEEIARGGQAPPPDNPLTQAIPPGMEGAVFPADPNDLAVMPDGRVVRTGEITDPALMASLTQNGRMTDRETGETTDFLFSPERVVQAQAEQERQMAQQEYRDFINDVSRDLVARGVDPGPVLSTMTIDPATGVPTPMDAVAASGYGGGGGSALKGPFQESYGNFVNQLGDTYSKEVGTLMESLSGDEYGAGRDERRLAALQNFDNAVVSGQFAQDPDGTVNSFITAKTGLIPARQWRNGQPGPVVFVSPEDAVVPEGSGSADVRVRDGATSVLTSDSSQIQAAKRIAFDAVKSREQAEARRIANEQELLTRALMNLPQDQLQQLMAE